MIEHFEQTEASLARLRGPIGIYIGSKTPPEIAVSVMAEILAVKNGVTLPREMEVASAKALREGLQEVAEARSGRAPGPEGAFSPASGPRRRPAAAAWAGPRRPGRARRPGAPAARRRPSGARGTARRASGRWW